MADGVTDEPQLIRAQRDHFVISSGARNLPHCRTTDFSRGRYDKRGQGLVLSVRRTLRVFID